MYDVNTGRIEDRLHYLDRMIDLLAQLMEMPDERIYSDLRNVAALERGAQLSIEAIVDVGNAMIDGFIMRDPGSYTDIVEILRDEQVISQQLAESLTQIVEFRKQLVNEYTQVRTDELLQLVRTHIDGLRQFGPAARSYIERELF